MKKVIVVSIIQLWMLFFSVSAYAADYLIADSVREFSDKQGQDDWYYGYYIYPFQSSDFILMDEFSANTWWVSNGTYWTSLHAFGGHPNGLITSGGRTPVEHWAVRRWNSEITGTITILGSFRKSNIGGGDGTIGYIYVDGVEVWSYVADYDDYNGTIFEIEVSVSQGSTVDFATSPGVNSNDHADGTNYSVVISSHIDSKDASFTSATGILHIPTVVVDGSDQYEVDLKKGVGWNFVLKSATPK